LARILTKNIADSEVLNEQAAVGYVSRLQLAIADWEVLNDVQMSRLQPAMCASDTNWSSFTDNIQSSFYTCFIFLHMPTLSCNRQLSVIFLPVLPAPPEWEE
jgi:hypothetical protein